MNVHILKDSKLSQNIYNEVIELLQKFNNPLNFIRSSEEILMDDVDIEIDIIQKSKFEKREEMSYSIMGPGNGVGYKEINFPFEREVAGPNDILKSCSNFRIQNDIGDQDYVILLTEQANNLNWFSYGDEKNNAFIHTSDWGFFLGCNSAFPISYEIVSNIYYMILFKGMDDINIHTHKTSIGCINDFCEQKKDIKKKPQHNLFQD